MAGVAERKAVLTRPGRLIAGGLGIAAAAVAGFLLYANRLELFVLPARWGRILELEEMGRGKRAHQPSDPELSAALEAFLEIRGIRLGEGQLWLEQVTTHEGYPGYVLVHMSTGATGHAIRLLLLDGWGRPVGDPMPAARSNDFQGHKLVHEDVYTVDIVRVNGTMACSDHSADRRGIVQRGLVLHGIDAFTNGHSDSVEICVSSGVSREVRHWLLADQRALASDEAIGSLLSTAREPDLFRALHEIERLGAKGASLARPLLAHENPDVRARAAAVCGNDPAIAGDLVPLLGDPSEKVKMAARFALLNAPDVAIGRRALLELIEKRLTDLDDYASYGYLIDFDVDRLMSPEVVTAILAWSRQKGEDAVHLESLERFFTAFRRDHLRPVASALVRHFKEVEAEPATGDNTLRILAWLLALTDAEESDRVLADILSRGTFEEDALGPVDILHALLHRKTPLHGANPETVLAKLPDSLWRASFLLQVWWGVPGALERLSERIHAAPDRKWLKASHPYPPFSLDDPEVYLFGGGLDLGLDEDGNHALWRRHTPPALLPIFIEMAARDADGYLDFTCEVLRAQEPKTLRSIEKEIVRLLEHTEECPVDLLAAAAKAGLQSMDPWLGECLRVLPEWEADPFVAYPGWGRDETLWGLLRYREQPPGPELVRAVDQIARSAGDPANPFRPQRVEIRKDRRAGWRTNIIDWPTWWLAATWVGIMDPQLAANILLVRWNVPGARERLLAKLREPGNDWIFDFLWEEFLPPSLVPDLKELAAGGSPELADRVEYLLEAARLREEKAAAKRP